MARRLTTDCDVCNAKDIGEHDRNRVNVHIPREPGEMDSGAEDVHLCHKCCNRVL